MRCLVVGGTGFLGGAIADAVVAAGHEVTILTRGETVRNPAGPVETVCADRHGDLSVVQGREFDWVFDTCAYTPDAVLKLLDSVGDKLNRYVMISSISAYGTFQKRGLTEDDEALTATANDLALARKVPAAERASAVAYGKAYGPLKRACEIAAEQRLGSRATALRVGLLIGAGDYTDRLTWWVRRIDEAHGDRRRVPAPYPTHRIVQLIDVRDAADFALCCAEKAISGELNVTGIPGPLSTIFNEIIRITHSQAEIVWIDEDAIVDAGIKPWTDMPLMAPVAPSFRYFLEVETKRAIASRLKCRSLEQTLSPLLVWDRGRRNELLKGGLTSRQEAVLLV